MLNKLYIGSIVLAASLLITNFSSAQQAGINFSLAFPQGEIW